MKKKIFTFIFISLALTVFESCQQEYIPLVQEEEQEKNEEQEVIDSDTLLVTMNPTSLEWSTSPLSRAATSDDLYAVAVYQTDGEYESEMNTVPYAITVFDDPALITLKLAKNHYYHFQMAYVPNGKNIIAKIGQYWGPPFYVPYAETPKLNTVIYNPPTQIQVGFINHPSQERGVKDWLMQYNDINEVLRFMGSTRNFKPEENNQKVTIQLYRWQYGIKIIARDFTEGTISFSSIFEEAKVLSMKGNSSGTNTMEYLLEYPSYLSFNYDNAADCANSGSNGGFYKFITYTPPTGEEIILWNSESFPFKRMTMHTLEFSLSDAIVNGGISPELMESTDDDMEEIFWSF